MAAAACRNYKVFRKTVFQTVSSNGAIVSRSARLHKESVPMVTAATIAEEGKFSFYRAIPGIKLPHLLTV
jgi:hypothetical protein